MVIGLDAELDRGIAMNDDFKFFNERLFYDAQTGFLYWRNTELVKKSVWGKEAGSIRPDGYKNIGVRINGKTKNFKAHRLAWLLVYKRLPKNHIDHINGNRLDNRMENLRNATAPENNQNLRIPQKNNKTGVLGVSLDKGMYKAQICINGKNKNIGRFDTIEKATKAYIQAKRESHEFCTI